MDLEMHLHHRHGVFKLHFERDESHERQYHQAELCELAIVRYKPTQANTLQITRTETDQAWQLDDVGEVAACRKALGYRPLRQ